MANGSEGERKQTEPEGKQTSQVRLEWERVEGIDEAYVANTRCVQIMVHGLFGTKGVLEAPSKPWLGSVSGARCYLSKTFDTKEEAQQYGEETAKELLLQDLKLLGGGGNVPAPSITGPVKRTRTPGVSLLKLGEFDLEDGSKRTGELALHSAGSGLVVRMPSGDDVTLGLGAVVESLAALPAEVTP